MARVSLSCVHAVRSKLTIPHTRSTSLPGERLIPQTQKTIHPFFFFIFYFLFFIFFFIFFFYSPPYFPLPPPPFLPPPTHPLIPSIYFPHFLPFPFFFLP